MKNLKTTKGFTLIELLVSISITAILMLGMSMFFSTTLHNLFQAQKENTSTQGQFVVNQILQEKFLNLEEITEQNTNDIVIKNKITKNELPFTYIGKNGGNLVFKDFFVFDGKYGTTNSSDYEANAGGITKIEENYYYTMPLENKIKCNGSSCVDLSSLELNHPTDITTDGTDLYVTDSKNNRIVKIDSSNNVTEIATNLSFPVGITHYNDGTNDYIFFSEPYNNLVKRINLTNGNTITTIAGLGDNADCGSSTSTQEHSALYCKLNFPTGLHIKSGELYIADTGSGRVLKVSDPGSIDVTAFPIEIRYKSNIKLDHIKITFHGEGNFSITPNITSTLHKGAYEINGQEIDYNFFTKLTKNIEILCTGASAGPPATACTNQPFTEIIIEKDIFNTPADRVKFQNNDILAISSGPTGTHPEFKYNVNGNIINHNTDEIVYISNGSDNILNKNIDDEDTITINLDEIYPSGLPKFIQIKVEIFNQDNTNIETHNIILRNGDNVLGTPEDIIEVVEIEQTYPTGLSYASSYIQIGTETNLDTTDIIYDYTSDFEIDSLTFSEPVADKILETIITTTGTDESPSETYILNASL